MNDDRPRPFRDAAASLRDRVVLITGASSGMGLEFARVFAGEGARVVVAARRTELLDDLAGEMVASGSEVLAVPLDITSLSSIKAAGEVIENTWDPVEILVNNAGVVHQSKAVDVTESDFARIFDTNVKGSFFVAQAFGRRMIELGTKGRIVNIASVAGLVTMPQLGLYGMSKAAIIHMTKVLAQEWGRHGICVNALAPGYIATELNEEFFASEAGGKVLDRLPKRRVGKPDDLMAALLLLASPAAGNLINGAVLAIDDGYSVQ